MTETAALPLWVEDAFTGPARPRPDAETISESDHVPARTAGVASADETFPGRERADATVVITQRELGLWRSLRRLFSPLVLGAAVATAACAWLTGTFANLPVAAQLALPLGGAVYAAFVGNLAGRLVVGATRTVKR